MQRYTRINTLKVDIEGAEYEAIMPLLVDGSLDSVHQLLLEIHLAPQAPAKIHTFMWALAGRGWVIFSKEANPLCLCNYEYSFLNLGWNGRDLISQAKQHWCIGGWEPAGHWGATTTSMACRSWGPLQGAISRIDPKLVDKHSAATKAAVSSKSGGTPSQQHKRNADGTLVVSSDAPEALERKRKDNGWLKKGTSRMTERGRAHATKATASAGTKPPTSAATKMPTDKTICVLQDHQPINSTAVLRMFESGAGVDTSVLSSLWTRAYACRHGYRYLYASSPELSVWPTTAPEDRAAIADLKSTCQGIADSLDEPGSATLDSLNIPTDTLPALSCKAEGSKQSKDVQLKRGSSWCKVLLFDKVLPRYQHVK